MQMYEKSMLFEPTFRCVCVIFQSNLCVRVWFQSPLASRLQNIIARVQDSQLFTSTAGSVYALITHTQHE